LSWFLYLFHSFARTTRNIKWNNTRKQKK
jgi:hypothetical protein